VDRGRRASGYYARRVGCKFVYFEDLPVPLVVPLGTAAETDTLVVICVGAVDAAGWTVARLGNGATAATWLVAAAGWLAATADWVVAAAGWLAATADWLVAATCWFATAADWLAVAAGWLAGLAGWFAAVPSVSR
jgi:hypothetical protein